MGGEGQRTGKKPRRDKVDAGEQPGGKIGRYVVVSRLGEGAMGMVYLAHDPKLDRQVALKVLRRRSRSSRKARERQQRLRREAQAMAQLNHTNVVTVHDVGVADGRVFLAMDYVPGQDLRAWLDAHRWPWNKVLRTFIYAGQGLAAAHEAGVIHRDFKPENVLVCEDGSVKVMDFGLARPRGVGSASASASTDAVDTVSAESEGASAERAPTAVSEAVSEAMSEAPGEPCDDFEGSEAKSSWWRKKTGMFEISGPQQLTRSGDVLGTPSYMAPELFEGAEANAQTDQFAFCVALFEGLYGVRPFAGESMAALAFNMNRERIVSAPRGSRVPVWLGRLVRRGLARDPARRYPSMQALIDALIGGAARRRIRRGGLVAAGLVLGGGALSYALVPTPTPCQGGEARMQTVWNEERAAAIAAAFEGTGVPYATEALNRAQQRIETYSHTWVSTYTEVCEATAVHHQQSDELLDQRIACLDERLAELDALLGVLGEADQRVAEHAAQAASELREPGMCRSESLDERRRSDDPEHREQVDQLRGRLLRAEALGHAGRYDDAATLGREIVAEAELLGDVELHGEALAHLGKAEDQAGQYESAADHLRRAYFLTNEAGLDLVAARAAVDLIAVEGVHRGNGEEGLTWARHAEVALERGDPESVLRGQYHRAVGMVHLLTRFDLPKARDHLERAIAIERQALGEDHEKVAMLLAYLGAVLDYSGRSEAALQSYEQALQITRKVLGPQHPELAIIYNNYAVVLFQRQDYPGAQAQLERAAGIQREALGEHPSTATSIDNLGALRALQGDREGGRALMEEALGMRERLLAADHPSIAQSLTNIGDVLVKEEDWEGARRRYERALSIFQSLEGPGNPQYSAVLKSLGFLALVEGSIQRGYDYCKQSKEIIEPLLPDGEDHVEITGPMTCLGWAALELRQFEEARSLLQSAYAMNHVAVPDERALATLVYSRFLRETESDRDKGEQLRQEAKEQYKALGYDPPERLAAWLRESSP